jgi:nicotinamide-nucleotide amidase
VSPLLADELGIEPALVRTVRTFGLGESQIDDRLAGVLDGVRGGPAQITVHYRATFPEVHVIFVARPRQGQGVRIEAQLDDAERRVRERLGPAVYGAGDTTFCTELISALQRTGARIATAESCTGGLVADMITTEPGSSSVFDLGIVAYANEIKQRVLGVPEEVLRQHGAVSEPCVTAMARGVRELAGATYGVATSGIAGPTGGTPDKPVGTVHVAMATEGEVWHLERVFPFDRRRNKEISAYVALMLVLRHLNGALSSEPLEGRWKRSREDG